MKNLKKSLILLLLITLNGFAFAQRPTQNGATGGDNNYKRLGNIGRAYGKIIDATTKQPVSYASVALYRQVNKQDSLVGGALTADNGDFNIEGLPLGGLKVKVTFMGYTDLSKVIRLLPPDNVEMDLGNLALEADAKMLGTVEVTAEKAQMVMSLDKKTFNVDKNITSSGGTAEGVLKNIPSVTVDVDGNAKLRNNTTTVYMDGRPTVMSLNQIPSDQIESVEVISNPSAKFDASTTGGILNIVMKKNTKPGYNGFIGLGVGTGNRYNGTGNLNIKQGKWNITAFGSLNVAQNPTLGYTYRNSTATGLQIYDQNTTTTLDNAFKLGRLNVDYSLNNRNTLSLGGTVTQGIFNINSVQNYSLPLVTTDSMLNNGVRNTLPQNNFTRYQVEGAWKKTFAQKGEALTADVTYGWSQSSNVSNWTTSGYDAKGLALPNYPELTAISGGSNGQQITAQLDYVKPINDSTKLEMGLRSNTNIQSQSTYFSNFNYLSNTYVQDNTLSLDTDITTMVNAAYLTYSGKLKDGIGYQAGLRYEQSKLQADSKLLDVPSFGYDYTGNLGKSLFPSLYLSKTLDKTSELQLNFSRKIQRPNFRQIMPVVQTSDPQNIQIGNPALQPEFDNLSELNYNKHFGKTEQNNWLVSAYVNYATNTIQPFASPSAADPSVLVTSFINANSATRYGLDNTLKLGLNKNFDVTANFNAYNLVITSANSATVNGFAYDGKMSLNYKLPKGFSTQLNGSYESDRVIPQGTQKGVAFADFAVKKTFLGGAANATLSVNDIFNSRKSITDYNFPTYFQETMRRRDLRYVKLSVQVPFGKADASIFRKAKDAKKQQDGQQDMDYGG